MEANGVQRQSLARPFVTEGFTLVELLVSITILLILVVALFELTTGVGKIWKSSGGKISSFQGARAAFSTLNETLSRATLNTYNDYVDNTGAFRTAGNVTTFVPAQFNRASELHFLCGPTAQISMASQTATATVNPTGAPTPERNPGDTIFFQAPLGYTATTATYTGLNRAMNSVGFYIQYGKTDTDLFPSWMSTGNVAGVNSYRFQLVQYVEATESLQIYNSTANTSYTLNWMKFTGAPQVRILAENIVLLLLRPRLSPTDESKLADTVSGGTGTYNESTQFGSILCPNYHYDSRAWQTGYTAGLVTAPKLIKAMKNQVPPIIDVAMVAVDPQSLARFNTTTDTPPTEVTPSATSFKDSAKMEADLNAYAAKLSASKIRFHIQRATVAIQSAKWSNN